MHKIIKEKNEIILKDEIEANNDLVFGLSGLRVNTTKKDKREDSRIQEDTNLK